METPVEFEGKVIRLTRLQKEMFPGISKAEVIKYYLSVSDLILPYLRGRPLTLQLYPDGVGGKRIVRKDAPFAPEWVPKFEYVAETGKRIRYVLCNDKATLVWLANLSNLEFHITLSTTQDYEHPDLLLFDLDPFPPANFRDACRVALLIKDLLQSLGIKGYVKTSGATGLHILVGLRRGRYSFEETRTLVRAIALNLERLEPVVLSQMIPVSERKGKVLIDFAQNSLGKTITAPYSLKPLPEAPVSTPLKWKELEGDISPSSFNMRTIRERLEKGDPMRGLLSDSFELPGL